MKRPTWCPHKDCKFKVHSQSMMCFGELPNPEPHDDDFNTNRLCIDTRETGHGIFDLQVNNADLWNLKRIITTSDPIHPISEEKQWLSDHMPNPTSEAAEKILANICNEKEFWQVGLNASQSYITAKMAIEAMEQYHRERMKEECHCGGYPECICTHLKDK